MPLVLILLALTKHLIKYCVFLLLFLFNSSFVMEETELKIGDKIPFFETKLINNKDFKISSLLGSYTLIQFWASWDLPSLKIQSELIKTYGKFKDIKFTDGKKFNVVSISIDQKEETFITTLKRELYPWQYHICDYNGWNSPLIDSFNIENIPSNFLINPKGVIIAKNLFYEDLDKDLVKYLNK